MADEPTHVLVPEDHDDVPYHHLSECEARGCGQPPDLPVSEWQREVAHGRTRLGYDEWAAQERALRSVEFSMDDIVQRVQEAGYHAFVEMTGGGCATIFAGPVHEEEGYGARYAAIAGPGWFDGPGYTIARAAAHDFYVGVDDDGSTDPLPRPGGLTTSTPEVVANAYAQQVIRVVRKALDQ